MKKVAIQTKTGKAFEYALLYSFFERLRIVTTVKIIENDSYNNAKKCFESFSTNEKGLYSLNASFSVNFLIDLEPRLSHGIKNEDILQLEIVSDKEGQTGDVRDVIAIRSLQKWEIGVSAKNNHRAVKHSRLSNDIDFGTKWIKIPCSDNYFNEIKPIFHNLAKLRTLSKATQKWSTLGDYHVSVYEPILKAFQRELLKLDKENSGIVAKNLVEYLIGTKDFYKIIKGKNKVEIQAYNLHGTLNMPFEKIKPKLIITKLKLPNRLIEIVFKDQSRSTLLVTLDEGWQISFRIHNASSRIEPSLKFDINLVSAPHTLFVNHLSLNNI